MYFPRIIDKYLLDWAKDSSHKPLLLRGARQVGKSSAVRHLGESFDCFVEVNFERQPQFKQLFHDDIDVERILPQLSAMAGKSINPGTTLLFLDEIQECPEAIRALRFFKEDMPQLHVVAAGSLLEFVLLDLPTFGVGRIHSMFMFPMTFDEFLTANGEKILLEVRDQADASHPMPEPLYKKIIGLMRMFMLVGGMPEAVSKWVQTHDYLKCQEVQSDILISYEDDFAKYKKRVDPVLLRQVLRSVALQAANKFIYTQVGEAYKSADVKNALELLILAGIVIPVTHTSANGIPLGFGADNTYRKMLMLDSGLMLRMLQMSMGDSTDLTTHIITGDLVELVNKGPVAEMVVGLELLHNNMPNMRHEMYYWQRMARNSIAEVDYVICYKSRVLPIEVKAGVQGGMKSLWSFMQEKKLHDAVRCSLENFGGFIYNDAEGIERHVTICPIFAISQLPRLLNF